MRRRSSQCAGCSLNASCSVGVRRCSWSGTFWVRVGRVLATPALGAVHPRLSSETVERVCVVASPLHYSTEQVSCLVASEHRGRASTTNDSDECLGVVLRVQHLVRCTKHINGDDDDNLHQYRPVLADVVVTHQTRWRLCALIFNTVQNVSVEVTERRRTEEHDVANA